MKRRSSTSIQQLVETFDEDNFGTDLHFLVFECVVPLADAGEKLTDAEALLVRFYGIDFQVCNGGFHQYFFNSWSDDAYLLERDFRTLGDDVTAKIVGEALAVVGIPSERTNRDQRWELLDKLAKDGAEKLDQLDDRYYKAMPNHDKLLWEFVRKHANKIRVVSE